MRISMQTMAIDSFVPMLQTLSKILDKAAAHATAAKLDLASARLAPDMYTLIRSPNRFGSRALRPGTALRVSVARNRPSEDHRPSKTTSRRSAI
ncbi:MAG TPA: DUF1993 family protein [Roseiarcus sp.]